MRRSGNHQVQTILFKLRCNVCETATPGQIFLLCDKKLWCPACFITKYPAETRRTYHYLAMKLKSQPEVARALG